MEKIKEEKIRGKRSKVNYMEKKTVGKIPCMVKVPVTTILVQC